MRYRKSSPGGPLAGTATRRRSSWWPRAGPGSCTKTGSRWCRQATACTSAPASCNLFDYSPDMESLETPWT